MLPYDREYSSNYRNESQKKMNDYYDQPKVCRCINKIDKNSKYCEYCLYTHDEKSEHNYIWLDVLGHGRVIQVWFEEPVGSGKYILYNTKWWKTHCEVVSHGDDLFKSHCEAFVYPETRFAKMLFLFENKQLIEGNERIYKLEQDYFDNNQLCK